jgi:hypothetical protein
MGNSGIRKIFFPGDYVETKHKSLFDITVPGLDRSPVNLSLYKDKLILVVNVAKNAPEGS